MTNSPTSIWVAGEVLVDLIPSSRGETRIDEQLFEPHIGGGPANTARALGRWGLDPAFIGGFSSDRFGHIAWSEMSRDGVNLELSLESDLPTAKAILALDEKGSARYRFETETTATFDFRSDWLPVASDALPYIFYMGSLATIVEPGASSLLSWLAQSKLERKIQVIFDPNVRPNFLNDSDSYREAIEKWIPHVDLIKASEEDISFLYPGEEQESIISKWIAHGVSLVVITRGERGMVAMSANESSGVEGIKSDLVDSVGAGDTVGAVLVDAMMKFGLGELQGENLAKTLEVAAHAAAITCSRQGANPPAKEEYGKLWR